MLASAAGMSARGRLITIEGLDGAGKTTVATGLKQAIESRGISIELLREPGGVRISERIRNLVKDPHEHITDRAEALLYAAARAQLTEEALEPLLNNGTWVLLDRFIDSSLAYQGGGRGLGIDQVRAINMFGTGGLTPDRTLLLVIDPATGYSRTRGRGERPDRLELENREFFDRIAGAYERLADGEPERIRRIDAARPPDVVLAEAIAQISDLL
jgi:dTMP kinase